MAAMQEGAGLGLEALSPTEVEKRVEDAACAKMCIRDRFYAEHFDNDYMQNRFQTMTMDVDDATRIGR